MRPCLAAVTLDERGGGVALVGRLLREVLRRRWSACDAVTLVSVRRAATMRAGPGARVRFGARLAIRQAMGKCDLVVYGHPSLARVQRHVPARFRRPYAIFVHGIEAWRPLPAGDARLYREAAVCLTNSRYTAGRVASENPGLPPLVVCPLALVPDECPPAAPWTREPIGPHAVVIVGRMSAAERYKGHDALLDAWPDVLARVPDARLVFVGDGDDRPRLAARAAALGDAVRLTGFLPAPDLHALYGAAAVFAMPSRGEGFGLVYLEAMAHGLPCIGSVHDAAREIVEDGVTGYLVDQSNPSQLGDRLVALLTDEARRVSMGLRGRERLEREFSFDRFADRVVAALLPADAGAAGRYPAARTA